MADDQYKEHNKFVARTVLIILLAIVAAWLLALLIFPITEWIMRGNRSLVGIAWDFWQEAFLHPGKIFETYGSWFKIRGKASSIAWYLPFIPIIVMPIIVFIGLFTNPYSNMSTVFGSGRLATYADIKKMGLFNGFVCVLGRFKGRLLKMPNTLSALVVAPPGTGKTAGVVIPTIFESDRLSIIVNDVKPELCYQTSGYRAKIGPVFIINWGAQDEPDKGIYYPSWNPLSPTALPPLGPARDMYIDSMVAVLVEEPKGGQDPPFMVSDQYDA